MSFSRYLLLIDTLARFALKADARRYFFGYFWWVLEPLLYVSVFYLVFYQLLGTQQPDFLAFLVVGKLAFIWFSKSVNQAASSLVVARGLIGQRDMPKLIFPMAVVQEGFYKQSAVFLLMLGYLALNGHTPQASWLWLLPVILVQSLLITFCAAVGALLVCLKRDFVIMINLGMVLLLFVSGVFWDIGSIPNTKAADWLLLLNPLAFLLEAYRAILLAGEVPDALHLGVLGASLLVATLVVFAVYQRLNFWIARRVVTM